MQSRVSKNELISVDRRTVEEEILLEAEIVFCTLSYAGVSGLNCLRDRIETVLVDEASQSTEASVLIPLKLNPKKMILFGDS